MQNCEKVNLGNGNKRKEAAPTTFVGNPERNERREPPVMSARTLGPDAPIEDPQVAAQEPWMNYNEYMQALSIIMAAPDPHGGEEDPETVRAIQELFMQSCGDIAGLGGLVECHFSILGSIDRSFTRLPLIIGNNCSPSVSMVDK